MTDPYTLTVYCTDRQELHFRWLLSGDLNVSVWAPGYLHDGTSLLLVASAILTSAEAVAFLQRLNERRPAERKDS